MSGGRCSPSRSSIWASMTVTASACSLALASPMVTLSTLGGSAVPVFRHPSSLVIVGMAPEVASAARMPAPVGVVHSRL